jgi:hypothetical protein
MLDTEHPFQLMFPLKFIVFVYPKLIQAIPQLNLKHYVMTPFSFNSRMSSRLLNNMLSAFFTPI